MTASSEPQVRRREGAKPVDAATLRQRIAAALAAATPGAALAPPRRTPGNVLDDIRSITREAWDEGDIKTALRGLEMESKLLGMFKDKPESIAPLPPEPPLILPDNGRK